MARTPATTIPAIDFPPTPEVDEDEEGVADAEAEEDVAVVLVAVTTIVTGAPLASVEVIRIDDGAAVVDGAAAAVEVGCVVDGTMLEGCEEDGERS